MISLALQRSGCLQSIALGARHSGYGVRGSSAQHMHIGGCSHVRSAGRKHQDTECCPLAAAVLSSTPLHCWAYLAAAAAPVGASGAFAAHARAWLSYLLISLDIRAAQSASCGESVVQRQRQQQCVLALTVRIDCMRRYMHTQHPLHVPRFG